MEMEDRLHSIEQTNREHQKRIEALERCVEQNTKLLSNINENIKTLVVVGQTLKWVGLFIAGLWVFLKTGNAEQLVGLFK